MVDLQANDHHQSKNNLDYAIIQPLLTMLEWTMPPPVWMMIGWQVRPVWAFLVRNGWPWDRSSQGAEVLQNWQHQNTFRLLGLGIWKLAGMLFVSEFPGPSHNSFPSPDPWEVRSKTTQWQHSIKNMTPNFFFLIDYFLKNCYEFICQGCQHLSVSAIVVKRSKTVCQDLEAGLGILPSGRALSKYV